MWNQSFPSESFSLNGSKRESLAYFVSFLLWPFGIMIAALKNWDKAWSKNIFWLFCIFFGFTFIIAKDGNDDASRHAATFVYYAHSNLSLKELWSSFYTESSNYIDVIQPLIVYLLSRITDNTSILFAVFGLIYGYFYSRNIWYILSKLDGKVTYIVLLFIVTYAFFWPIWNIGNFRMVLAVQIFIYGTMPYLLDGNIKKLIWTLTSVLVHFSLILPVGVLVTFILLKNRLYIYFVFFVITAFINEIDLQWLQTFLLKFLPDIFDSKITGYANPDTAEDLRIFYQSYNWYVLSSRFVLKGVIYAFVLYIFFFGRKKMLEFPYLTSLFCFSLLLYGFANILNNMPSGHRYVTITNSFMFACFILFINMHPKMRGLSLLKTLSIPLLLFVCVIELWSGMLFYGFMTLIGNPFVVVFDTNYTPLSAVIKQLIL